MASLDEGFDIAAKKFQIKQFNHHQKEAIQKMVERKQDVFINLPTGYGKSLIYQALPCILDHKLGSSDSIVVVVSPLLNLIKDQIRYLNSLDISAISISDIESEEDRLKVEQGNYSLVYGTPEAWLKNERWRAMLQNTTYSRKVCALAIDEAHVIKQWGTSINKKLAPFRDSYSKLHEFRSLTPGVIMIALTATATESTRKTIFDVLRMKNPHVIFESPNKENITYSVEYLPKDFEIENYFSWLVEDLKEKNKDCDRAIIYCQTINQCSLLYAMLRGLLGENLMTPDGPLLEMLHSCTPLSNKQKILQSFTEENGNVRVLIATIAFGMGIDCKAVRQVIHFGPSKNIESYAQETGRAGRDGAHSSAFLLFNGFLLSHVEGDMRSYIEGDECRRSVLLNHFQAEYTPLTPKHLCCDICATKCQCEMPDCRKSTTYPKKDVHSKGYVPLKCRQVSKSQSEQVQNMLKMYHKSLVAQLMDTVPQGNLNTLTDVSFLLGFSDIQINQVLDNLKHLFTLNDICNLIEVWDTKHSKKILQIIRDVFDDVNELDSDETTLDEDLLLDEWEVFLEDDDLLNMAAENLFQESHIATGYHQLSQLAEDSFYEHNGSDSNASVNVGIPNAIHEVLSGMSPDP